MPKAGARLVLTLALSFTLMACAPSHAPTPEAVRPQNCATLYVLAPGNFIIDVASGAKVLLDPSVQEFPLFCSPEAAVAALKPMLASGRLAPGDWRIFSLEGDFTDLVQPAEPGGPSPYALAKKARLADWVSAKGAK